MKCSRCRHDNPAGTKFCGQCAAPLASLCAACGTANPPDNKFCGQCAAPLRPAAAPSFPAPETYTPTHLAERILTSRSALEGERKQVTVLFADLKGSLELLADRDPEEARKLLDPVLERMMEAVHRYEGTVNQVMGDGIMALFGAPLAQEDHAVRACYAALDMQAAIQRYADEVRRSHGVGMQIRIGLNSGDVVVRAIGSDLRMDYSAIGQTTHLAARMEQLAAPGSTLLTANTLRLVEGYVEVKPLGLVPVKGLETPIDVYELASVGPLRSRLHAAAARGLTRFVGRAAELEQLGQALGRAAAGHGQVVAVIGEAGVGKSRLVWEVTHSHRTHGWLVLQAASVSYGRATPYLPVVYLLKGYCQIEDRDDPRRIREKVTGKLLALDRVLEGSLPPFLALLDVPVDDEAWQTLDPAQRRERILDALKGLLLREGQIQPLLLVFEDLHWIDTETQALLDILVESIPTARVLLLLNYRPEYQHAWGNNSYYTQLQLDPLAPQSVRELLDGVLGVDASLGPLKSLLIERTEGNPFFLEESVRALIETKALAGERGAYRLTKPVAHLQVPATTQAVLAARIDRLLPEDKHLLQSASVIGKDVDLRLLKTIIGRPEEELRHQLANLQAAEFLYETSLFPDVEYTFKHALTHEVAYQSLLQERRRALHAEIVPAIERLYEDRLVEQTERLAHHARSGEVWDKAVVYLRQAGAKAEARSAHRDAVECLEQALEALDHLPDSRGGMQQAIDIRFELRNSLFPLGDQERILEHLREAEILAERLKDQRRLGQVCCYVTNCFRMIGDYPRAIDSGHRALVIATDLDDFAFRIQANCYLGQTYYLLGDYGRAMDFLRNAVAALVGPQVVQRFGLPALPAVFSRTWLAWCLAERGEFPEAIIQVEEALRIAKEADHPSSLIVASYGAGGLYLRQGDLGKAIPALERALDLCQAGTLPVLFVVAAMHLGSAYALAGRVAEATALLERAVDQAVSMRMPSWHATGVAWLGEAYQRAGRTEEAMDRAQRALELFRQRGERAQQAWTLALLGEISADGDPTDPREAEGFFRQAMALANELEMRPLVARCYLGLGALHRKLGHLHQARHELSASIELFRTMQMTFWLTQAQAEFAKA